MMPAPPRLDPILTQDGFCRVTVHGCELRYYRSGTGPPTVLLHPLRAQLEYFVPLLRHLDLADADVLAVDLPGHGQSSAPRTDYTASYFTDAAEGLLDAAGVREAVVVGESIGGAIALALAARHNPRVARVVALNPYDYGRRGGIRRSSALANVLFTAILWPVTGPVVARAGTRGVLSRVLAGGLYDSRNLPGDLVDELYRCGSLPGHARAFRSLCLQWESWLAARAQYPSIEVPVTLVYGDHDWSRPPEREANENVIHPTRTLTLAGCGHFSCLEKPAEIAQLIRETT
jgi:pimeloyl-ACP methyl ester carboxylesterase